MNILFEDKEKKFKTSFLKELENNVKVLKNLFDEVYIDSKGLGYMLENKIENGRIVCDTTLNKLFEIREEDLLKINVKVMSDCLKIGKTKIIGYYIEDDKLVFRTTEMNFEVGTFERNMVLNIDYIHNIINNISYRCNLNELLDRFNNKEFINIKKGKYDLILTHKLFPMINKSSDFSFGAKDNDNGSFYGVFMNNIIERNKKEEVTFKFTITYIYRFLDLN